jgi:CHASE3 domain sensor protein
MLSLLTNKFVLGLLGALLIVSGIGFMYWNMNRWKEKVEVLENQLEAMTAARDLLINVIEAKNKLEQDQQERRVEVEKEISEGKRDFFNRGMQ